MSEIITKLEQQANAVNTSPDSAIVAMVHLARIYGEGKVVPADLGKALDWAIKAAQEDSPDGYMEFVKILGSGCIATDDPPFKLHCANNVFAGCNEEGTKRLNRPDIACAIGTAGEYMADYCRVNHAPADTVDLYHKKALIYYAMALELGDDQKSQHIQQKEIATAALSRLDPQSKPDTPTFNPREILPYFGAG